MIKDFIRTVRVRAVRALASTRPRLDVSERRVLVVAPHPDDEVFGCAGLVQQLVQSGTQVDVVIVTGGGKSHAACCGLDEATLIRQRRALACWAAQIIGLPEARLHFLDYPDGGIRWEHPETERLRALLREFRPDAVFVPHAGEGWPDHVETRRIVRRLLERDSAVELYEYCVWFWFYNVCRIDWSSARIVRLTPEQHRAKLSAIHAYVSAKAPCGRPWSGVLPRVFVWANTWNRELYFRTER